MNDTAGGGGNRKKDKEKKKKKIVISLWINKTKYNYGCLCTFCGKIPAILHCPDCPDFVTTVISLRTAPRKESLMCETSSASSISRVQRPW